MPQRIAYSFPVMIDDTAGDVEFNDIIASGTLAVAGATSLSGNVAIGNATTDTVGFYGIAAVSQRAGSAQTSVATTTAVSASAAACFGYSTSAQANGIVTLLNELKFAMSGLGLIAGS